MVLKHVAGVALVFVMLSGSAYADAKPKVNGDDPGDTAPLDTSGHAADSGGVAQGNTPPIGGATQGGGGNPKESGPVDAARTGKSGPGNQQPDNK